MKAVYLHTGPTEMLGCPVCRATLNMATCVSLDGDEDPVPPAVGDVTVCGHCGAILRLAAPGWQLATDEDLAGVDSELATLLLQVSSQVQRPGTT